MRVIVDTQSLIWFVDQDHLLSRVAHATIKDPNNVLLMSTATYWEMAIKIATGKLNLSMTYRPWLHKAISDLGLVELPVTLDYAERQIALPFHHRDPFDRMIIAQALVENIPVVSNDAIFDSYGVTRIWN